MLRFYMSINSISLLGPADPAPNLPGQAAPVSVNRAPTSDAAKPRCKYHPLYAQTPAFKHLVNAVDKPTVQSWYKSRHYKYSSKLMKAEMMARLWDDCGGSMTDFLDALKNPELRIIHYQLFGNQGSSKCRKELAECVEEELAAVASRTCVSRMV